MRKTWRKKGAEDEWCDPFICTTYDYSLHEHYNNNNNNGRQHIIKRQHSAANSTIEHKMQKRTTQRIYVHTVYAYLFDASDSTSFKCLFMQIAIRVHHFTWNIALYVCMFVGLCKDFCVPWWRAITIYMLHSVKRRRMWVCAVKRNEFPWNCNGKFIWRVWCVCVCRGDAHHHSSDLPI